jgi:hypothetical protein
MRQPMEADGTLGAMSPGQWRREPWPGFDRRPPTKPGPDDSAVWPGFLYRTCHFPMSGSEWLTITPAKAGAAVSAATPNAARTAKATGLVVLTVIPFHLDVSSAGKRAGSE